MTLSHQVLSKLKYFCPGSEFLIPTWTPSIMSLHRYLMLTGRRGRGPLRRDEELPANLQGEGELLLSVRHLAGSARQAEQLPLLLTSAHLSR